MSTKTNHDYGSKYTAKDAPTTTIRTEVANSVAAATTTTSILPRHAAIVEKVLFLDELIGTIYSFVNIATLATSCSVCTFWRDVGTRPMFWTPYLERRWGPLLPMNKHVFENEPKQMYRQCLISERNVMTPQVQYDTTRTLMDSKETPLCMQFDGDTLMSGHIDKNVHIYDLKSGQVVKQLKGHTSWVKCLKFDSKVLVTGSYDATIKEWSRTNNEYKLIKEYKGHGSNGVNLERSPRGSVVCLQFDAHRIVSGSNDTTLRVWNRETGHCEQIITGHDRTVRCLEFKNHTCFSGGSDRYIKGFDLNTGQLTTEFSGHGHRVSCLQMHRMNENIVISGSNDRTARIWDARVGNTAVALVAEHEDAIRRLQFDDLKLITGGDDQLLRTWDMRTLTSNCSAMNYSTTTTGIGTWEHLAGGNYSANLGATRPLSRLLSSDPTHRGRVSALQFDCTRLICAFTLGQTTNGTHRRRGSIKIWNFVQLEEFSGACSSSSDVLDTNNTHK